MTNQSKNPIFWGIIVLVLGMGLGIWGMIKGDCIGPNCWVGSGFLKWTGGLLCIAGLAGMAVFGGGKEKR